MATTPSIALIPSGFNTSKIYSVLPENGDADFSFPRSTVANRINSDGLIEEMAINVPRLDYKNGFCPSLLLEPQSTNLITYPLSFDNAYWTKSNATVIGGFLAPSVDNPTSAYLMQLSNAGGNFYALAGGTGYYTFSVYAKYKDAQFIRLRSTGSYAYFDIQNGIIGSEIGTTDTNIEALSNGWYRCSVTGNNTNSLVQIFVSNTNGSNTGTGGAYLFGAQLEALPYATSIMIPTTEGSTVTRVAEIASKSGLDNYIGKTEGTMFIEVDFGESTADSTLIRFSLNNGVSSDNWIFVANENGYNLRVFVRANASNSVDFRKNNVFTSSGNYKIAMSFKSNETKCYVNGVLEYNSSSGIIPNNLDSIGLGGSITGNSVSNKSKIKEYKLYNTALTDAELTTLTTK